MNAATNRRWVTLGRPLSLFYTVIIQFFMNYFLVEKEVIFFIRIFIQNRDWFFNEKIGFFKNNP